MFLAEGARLGSKLGYSGSDQLTTEAHTAELMSPGLTAEHREPFLATIARKYRGGPIGLVRKSFLDVAKAAKVKGVSAHTLKHTAITWMLQKKLTPWQVSGVTATSVATIFPVYGHHVQDDLRV